MPRQKGQSCPTLRSEILVIVKLVIADNNSTVVHRRLQPVTRPAAAASFSSYGPLHHLPHSRNPECRSCLRTTATQIQLPCKLAPTDARSNTGLVSPGSSLALFIVAAGTLSFPPEAVELCASRISGRSFIALCKTCKDLHLVGLDVFRQRVDLVQEWVREAVACSMHDREQYTAVLKWLLGQAIKAWGIITLPAKLDLQAALLDTEASYATARLLISVGARLTDSFIFAAALVPYKHSAPWVRLHQELGLVTGLSPALESLCLNRPLSQQQLQQLSAEDRYKYFTVAVTNPTIVADRAETFLAPSEAVQGWSQQQVFTLMQLLMEAVDQGGHRVLYVDCIPGLLSLPAAAELSLDEVETLFQAAVELKFGIQLLLDRLMAFGQQLTASAVYDSCSALIVGPDNHYYNGELDVIRILSTPAAQQLSGEQVMQLLDQASDRQEYGILRQLLQMSGAASMKPDDLTWLLDQLLDSEVSGMLLGDVRELLMRIPLRTSLQVWEQQLVKQEQGFCSKVQGNGYDDEDECHACLLLHSMASAAAPGGHGQGGNVGNAEVEYASVGDLPVDKKVALLKQAVHHYWFGELLSALPDTGEGSREALTPQLQGIMFEALREVLLADKDVLECEPPEKEAALQHLLKQQEVGLLSVEQVQQLLEIARAKEARYVRLLLQGIPSAKQLQQ